MKNQIHTTVRQAINNVNNSHSLYTRDEVTNVLWTLDAKLTDVLNEMPEQTDAVFTRAQVEQMLFEFGQSVLDKTITLIEGMDLSIDTDLIEMDDDDYDVQIGRGNCLEIRYDGSFTYNGTDPSEIVIYEIEEALDLENLRDDASLFLNNVLSKQANDLVTLERGEVEWSEFTVTEK